MKYLMQTLVLTFTLSAAAVAQPIGDLELQVVQGPPIVTPPNTTGNVTFSIVNHGPDAIGVSPPPLDDGVRLIALAVPFRDGLGSALFFRPVACDHVWWSSAVLDPRPGQEATTEFFFAFPLLQPGESWSCTLEYEVRPFAGELIPGGHLSVPWIVTLADGNIDPNPDNDTASLPFNLTAPRIPTLSPAGLVALAFGMVLAFAWVLRTRLSGSGRRGAPDAEATFPGVYGAPCTWPASGRSPTCSPHSMRSGRSKSPAEGERARPVRH